MIKCKMKVQEKWLFCYWDEPIFEKEVKKIPNVLECNLMAGSADYLLKVVATDTNDFAQLHRKFLASLPGVAQIQSSFSLKNVFKETGLPV